MTKTYFVLLVAGVIDVSNVPNYQKVLNNYIIVSIYISNIYDFSDFCICILKMIYLQSYVQNAMKTI
ncbi:hypothetical protein BH23THE1_BH23THE1_18050 [soil metagenome]